MNREDDYANSFPEVNEDIDCIWLAISRIEEQIKWVRRSLRAANIELITEVKE